MQNIYFITANIMTFYWQWNGTGSELKHPTTIWTKWSGKDWVFRGWDRNQQAEIELKLPEEFIVVAEGMWVEGYNEGSVTSNEFFNKGDVVKVTNWWTRTTLFEWTWESIKDKVKAAWYPIWKHLHVIFPGEEGIKTLKIKWTAWVAWSDFNALNSWAPANNRIKITWTLKWKKGATSFVTPKFELWNPLSEEDLELQKKYWLEVFDYYNATKLSKDDVKVKDIDDASNLPF